MIKLFKKNKGTVLIITSLVLAVMMILGAYFLTFVISESKISRSQIIATQAYYLAEAGINQAIWKLKNDTESDDGWGNCFISMETSCDCNDWSASFNISTDFLMPDSAVIVEIKNSHCATGRITSTSSIHFSSNNVAQRVVKTSVFRAIDDPNEYSAIFTGGSSQLVKINDAYVRVEGDIFSNHKLSITKGSMVEAYAIDGAKGRILAASDYSVDADCFVTSTAICANDRCETIDSCECNNDDFQECLPEQCRPVNISVPTVDFNEGPNSFKSRAENMENNGLCHNFCNGSPCDNDDGGNKCYFSSANEFGKLLSGAGEGGTLALGSTSSPVIIYVNGSVAPLKNQRLIIYGILVANSHISVGKNESQSSQITVIRPTETTASGLLTTGKIDFGKYSGFEDINIEGVIYASDEASFIGIPKPMYIAGGIIAGKLELDNLHQWLDVTLDKEVILYGLGYKLEDGSGIQPIYSPIINIDHWEESY